MAFHKLLRPLAVGISMLLAGTAAADETVKPNTLTPKQVADGWVLLFDGESAFGWTAVESPGGQKPELVVKDGSLVVSGTGGGIRLDTQLRYFDLTGEYRSTDKACQFVTAPMTDRGEKSSGIQMSAELVPGDGGGWVRFASHFGTDTTETFSRDGQEAGVTAPGWGLPRPSDTVQIRVEPPKSAAATVELRNLKLRPLAMGRLFKGKDLTGWTPFTGDAKRSRSKFSVTPAGELSVKDGPGDLQTEKQFDDFVLQLDCKTNGKALNSGVFFRCLPGQYQQGYEAQIQNSYLADDRTKPVDFGTGAIYRRVKARKVVSNDDEWFTMTVVARGPHLATWVNGYPVVNWTDDRKPADNARNGLYTKKGPISLQGHDPTTDLLFRNIRIAELK